MASLDFVEDLTLDNRMWKIRVKVDRLYQTYNQAGDIKYIEMVLQVIRASTYCVYTFFLLVRIFCLLVITWY